MPSRIARWGNSLSVRLPANVVEYVGAEVGDSVFMRASDSGEIIITLTKPRERPAHKRSPTKATRALDEW